MKLRNKKTGEAVILIDHIFDNYKSLAEFNEEWEDVEGNIPLIKDEKVRKAVRAWAEACGLKYAVYKQASNEFYDTDTRGAFAIKFKIMPVEVYLKDGECYTIAELCGEEE